MKDFTEVDERDYAGAIVIIDVDGTLTHDRGADFSSEVRQKITQIAKVADVYLFSNNHRERTEEFARQIAVKTIDSSRRKPSSKVLEKLPVDKRVFVIGDKLLTDGLFAAAIGASYVQVVRIRHEDDRHRVRFSYALDDTASLLRPLVMYFWPLVLLLRPQQWVKNLLIFAPLFFAGEALQIDIVRHATIAFVVFCASASAMYIFNDLNDVEADRQHPKKRLRPLAIGALSHARAWGLFCTMLVIAIGGLLLIPAATPIVAAYVIGNILYSMALKHVAVLDVLFVALFYVMRIIAGGTSTDTYVSPWIIMCVFFGALFMIVGKRRAEFIQRTKKRVVEMYSQLSLDIMLATSSTLAIISYGMYSVLGNSSEYAVYSTFFVIAAIFMLLNRMYRSDELAEYPEILVFKDRGVLLVTVLWVLYMGVLFYAV